MKRNRRKAGPRMAPGVTRRRACGFRRCVECGRVIGPLALSYRATRFTRTIHAGATPHFDDWMIPAGRTYCPACAFWAGLVEG